MHEYPKMLNVYKRNIPGDGSLRVWEWSSPWIQYLSENEWSFTEKIDGMNIRVMVDTANLRIAFYGRTGNARIPVALGAHLSNHFLPQSEKLFASFPNGACFYGEGFGAGIQKSGCLYNKTQSFIMFDVVIGGVYLDRSSVEEIGSTFHIPVVPQVGTGTLHEAINIVSAGIESQFGNFEAEGIVARPIVELKDNRNQRIIVKIQSRDFELLETVD